MKIKRREIKKKCQKIIFIHTIFRKHILKTAISNFQNRIQKSQKFVLNVSFKNKVLNKKRLNNFS